MRRGLPGVLEFYPNHVYPSIKRHPSIRWGTYAYRLVRRHGANGKQNGTRRMGGPCLSHLSFKLFDGAVHLTTLYRSHDYGYKVPGNLLGLASVLAELKKTVRERGAYPSYRNRLMEELGDLLWYLTRLVTVLAPPHVEKLEELTERSGRGDNNADKALVGDAFTLGGAAGALLGTLQQNTGNVVASQLGTIWCALHRVAAEARVDLREAAAKNLEKTQSRWPPKRDFVPLFDERFDETEQIPRRLDVEFRQIRRGGKQAVLLRCSGLNIGDRLTDNIDHPDFYRFHDVFHLAHAVYLGSLLSH